MHEGNIDHEDKDGNYVLNIGGQKGMILKWIE
jgi:hypothetical protein